MITIYIYYGIYIVFQGTKDTMVLQVQKIFYYYYYFLVLF